jgi:hypothetical protein
MSRKLAIAGKGIGGVLAPIEGDVWGIGDYFMHRYCSAVWEMHDYTWTVDQCLRHKIEMYENMPDIVKKGYTAEDLYVGALLQYANFKRKAEAVNHFNIPLVTVSKYLWDNPVQGVIVPTSVEYPLYRVIFEVLGGRDYLIGTANYALAYAIYTGKYDAITLYGVNLRTWEEWAYQRPNCELLIGIALGRGIQVEVIGSEDGLLMPPRGILYGYIDTYPTYDFELGPSAIEEAVLGMLEQKEGEFSHETGGNYDGI